MSWVQLATNLLKLHFKSAGGKRSTSQYNIAPTETDPTTGAGAAIATAAANISTMALTSSEIRIGAVNTAPGSPTTGPYCRGADKVNMWFRTSTGQPVKLAIGAPKETILDSGKVYVDPAQADVDNLITVMKTNACDASGAAIKGFERGYRNRPPRRKHQ